MLGLGRRFIIRSSSSTFAGSNSIVASLTSNPSFINNHRSFSNSVISHSIFGDLTQAKETNIKELELQKKKDDITSEEGKDSIEESSLSLAEQDKDLQQYYLEEAHKAQIKIEKYITPLKQELFNQVVSKYGFYKNNKVINNNSNDKLYKLSLNKEEIELLEPSIYLKSYRIKSSLKKATQVNRFVRGLNVKNAINQLHFNPKKMSTELEILLKRGIKQAQELGIDEDSLYIDSLWVGSDGDWRKRPDWKGRGRVGLIKHSWVHLKVVLKTNQTQLRRQWEKDQNYLKPRMFLNNEPLNFKVRPYYKW
ncbi:ribosomal protein L22/L17 [Scheffersomyces coipomensis]|uniref:ribosomal protein L22/L17 n=1 Tax=Scheffersomyces coipomensis TaxID=1788519 RepID=UPI00315D5E47